MKKTILIAVPVAVVLAAAVLLLAAKPWAATTRASQGYEFTSIARGSIESIVSSSGTLAPVSEVSVLSQMSGRVEKVFADYNSHVRKGQVLAQLNTDMLKLQELESESAVAKAQANYDLQRLDAQNKANLFKKGLLAEYDLKSSETTLEVYAAELAAAQSALKVIRTELNQYALITSPIDGIVIDMNVEVGQNALEGSSSNATSLFTLAEDLSKMEIKAEVDELDISSIKVGQEVRFTVEANPGLTFNGTVHEIRLVPVTTDNVVTYYVMIDADNTDGALLPGMTADVQFIKQKKSDVLVVPTAAFRFQPTNLSTQEIARLVFLADSSDLPADQRLAAAKSYDEQVKSLSDATRATQTKSTGLVGMMMPGRPPGIRSGSAGGVTPATSALSGQARKSLWYVGDDGQLAVLRVTVGVTDSTNTEISGTGSLEGRKIILKVRAE
jgi:HlyD family secretion protein